MDTLLITANRLNCYLMYESVLPSVLEAYGIKYLRIFECQKGYRNEIWPVLTDDKQMVNVTFFKREAGIVGRVRRADAVSEYLNEFGMPTRVRINQRILALKNNNITVYSGVYNYLSGDTIPWEAYTMEHIKTLGATMSNMHSVLSAMRANDFPSVYVEYIALLDRMKVYFSKSGVIKALTAKLELKIDPGTFSQYIKLLQTYNKMPVQQVLHMDFVRGNILFKDKKISGIIDFEKTAVGHTVVDIARTLAFLLVDCKYKSREKVMKYFLYSGYQKRGRNKDIGDDIVRNKFVEMFLLYDLYKFLLHNPYESLEQNEHYVRTKDILVDYGVILYKQ